MVCDPRWALLLFFVGCRVFTEPFLHSCEQVGCFRRLVVTPFGVISGLNQAKSGLQKCGCNRLEFQCLNVVQTEPVDLIEGSPHDRVAHIEAKVVDVFGS